MSPSLNLCAISPIKIKNGETKYSFIPLSQNKKYEISVKTIKSETVYKNNLFAKIIVSSFISPFFPSTRDIKIKNNIIIAPSEGVITNLKVHSPKEVIKPHDTIMYIVPKTNKYFIEAMINPTDIDKVHVGQLATVNFPSYVDPAAKPIEAKVIYISADIIKTPKNQFYKAKLIFTKKGLKAIKENNFKIIPGMPVVVFIKAERRSFASYVLLPIEQLLKGAFHAN